MNIDLARQNLTSGNAEKTLAALTIVSAAGALSDLPATMALIKHANPRVQKKAMDTCLHIIRESLIAHFNELEPAMRQKLGQLMETLHPKVVLAISKDVYSDDDQRRLRAVQILGLLRKNPKVRDILADLVKDRDQKIRATAINLLGKVVGPNDQDIILSLLNDSDKRVRANTIEALESLGNTRLIPILLRFRKDPNNRIRGNVIKALYTLGHTDVSGDLTAMLQTNEPFMMASALWVMTQLKIANRELEDLAGHALLHENAMVLDNAEKALAALATPRAKGYLHYLCEPESKKSRAAG